MSHARGERILARSLFRELRGHGYTPQQILGLTGEMLDLVTEDLRAAHRAAAAREESVTASEEHPQRAGTRSRA